MLTKQAHVVGKIILIDLLDTRLPQTFNVGKKNAISAKQNKAKYNTMRYA